MANRKRIDHGPGGTFVFECDGQRYAWTDCYVMAEIAFMPAIGADTPSGPIAGCPGTVAVQ